MRPASEGGVPGTRPEGVQDEREAAAHVRAMFSRIAPRYDLLNHLLSLDIDKVWRRRVAKRFSAILHNPTARVLDLCCGTGDLAQHRDRKSTHLNSSHANISYAVFCLKKKKSRNLYISNLLQFIFHEFLTLT